MSTLAQKLSSRKLWTAIAGVIMGVAMVFGLDTNTISTIAGAVVALVSVVSYIRTEGKIDAAKLKEAVDKVKDAADAITGTVETK